MNPTVKILQKTDFTRENGTRNIFLRLTIKRKVKYYPLYVYAKPDHFNNGKILKTDPDHANKNLLIEVYSNKANDIILQYKLKLLQITFDNFIRDFHNSSYDSKSFFDFVESQIKVSKGKLAPGTIKNYKNQMDKMKGFILSHLWIL